MSTSLQQGVAALEAGDKALARRLFGRAIQEDPQSEQAWLWLSGAVESDKERLMCLNKVLAINPDNEMAQRGMVTLRREKPGQPVQAKMVQPLSPSEPAIDWFQAVSQSPPTVEVDHSLGVDALSSGKLNALKSFTQLVSHDLARGRSQRQVVGQLTERGFPEKTVKQFVNEIAKTTKRVRGQGAQSQGVPPWAWLFIVACGVIPLVAFGGAIPTAIGVGGASGCAAIARNSSRAVVIRIVACIGVTVVCWVLFLITIVGVAAVTGA